MSESLQLRYGMNPHQQPAWLAMDNGTLPLQVLNGQPGYINLLDALNGWQLVRELKQALNLPAAASFKHVSPAGAAVAVPLEEDLRKSYFVDSAELSALATAYARARGADRVSSFGDWIALSDPVDVPTAQLIHREVSDGVIAPSFEPEALKILQGKKKGRYTILQIDLNYQPPPMEKRDLFGLSLVQKRDMTVPTKADLSNTVTVNKNLPASVQRDMLVALITLKYTQSNSVCFAIDGQVIGIGAGQQSRIHCTRLAAAKADTWFLRQHQLVQNLPFHKNISRTTRDNAIDQYLFTERTPADEKEWLGNFYTTPKPFTSLEKKGWLEMAKGVTLGSDAFFPFRDSIDRARTSGVNFVVQPGGSIRDEDIISACDQYGMVMVLTGTRLFHH